MKRSKKLAINISIIAIILLGYYYFGGYYISKEQCVLETIRALYGNETDVIMELKKNNIITTLVADTENKTLSVVGTKKIGFLYHTASSYVGHKINEENKIDICGGYTSKVGMYLFIYRNDKTVDKIEVTLEDGTKFTLDEWHDDFVGIVVDSDNWYNGTYKVYNVSNQKMEEVFY